MSIDVLTAKFAVLFKVPDFVVPHLSQFVAEDEMELVVLMDGRKCSVSKLAVKMNCGLEQCQDLLDRCYVKSIVNKEQGDAEPVYFAADFYARLDYVCKFAESYQQIDQDLYKALDQWCYEVYAEQMGSYLNTLLERGQVDRAPETFELIENLDELFEAVQEIRLVPCNCRKLAGHCSKPTETCLSFDHSITERSFGQPLTKEEAKEIVKSAHRKGLMHQVNSDWRTNGLAWMCNCCSCCCYPTRLALERGTKGVFPVIQYAAQVDALKCKHCGVCTKRCNFSAFAVSDQETVVNGQSRMQVIFDPQKCWGCGICVETCPHEAISMAVSGNGQ